MKTVQFRETDRPRFERNQRVSFMGGTGQISSLWAESGAWIYAVEISQAHPRCDSYSKRTTVFLDEGDLWKAVSGSTKKSG